MKWTNFFRFAPRAGREEYAAVNCVVQFLSLCVFGMQSVLAQQNFSGAKILLALMAGLVMLVVSVFVIWVSLAAAVRRMHDLNLSGWWYGGYLAVVMIGAVSLQQVWWIFSIMGIAAVLFLCLKKESSENRFGAPAAAFLPDWFSRRGVFEGAIGLGLLFALVQAGLARMPLN